MVCNGILNPGPDELGSPWIAQTQKMMDYSKKADYQETASFVSVNDEDMFDIMSEEHENFFEAAREGDTDRISAILAPMTDLHAKWDFINYQNDGNGCYAIQEAARCDQLEVVKLLLEHGADITMSTINQRMTPFLW